MTAWGALVFFLLQSMSSTPAQVVPSEAQQIAAAVLPLPEHLRSGAGVRGYDKDLKLVTLRVTKNAIICTGLRPGATEFDVRCYHESFLPVVDRIRELYRQGAKQEEVYRLVDAEARSGKFKLPPQPTAGYRMEGPIGDYNAATNTAGPAIESWQSIHFPYRTASEIGLPEEGSVPRTIPYVMSSGTIWSHVMIEHEVPHK